MRDLDNGFPHPFGPSITYDLLHEGRRYPPKAVIGLAAKLRNGIELAPSDFPGGEDTAAFDAIRRLGFEIVPKSDAASKYSMPSFAKQFLSIYHAPSSASTVNRGTQILPGRS